jgi:hypothetical protein
MSAPRGEKVLFVITTDGMENASREYSYDKIRLMIERQKDRYGWEFIFLGANIDAIETAARLEYAKIGQSITTPTVRALSSIKR